MTTPFGDAQVDRDPVTGALVVVRADRTIGISVELLAAVLGTSALPVDEHGHVWLAGDPAHKYVPERFCSTRPPGADPVADSSFIVCRRVEP